MLRMARSKVNPEELERFLERGGTQAEAARFFGVSEPAACAAAS